MEAHGPSANRLVPGDVIVAVNDLPVRTMAELRARLYVLLPGTSIALSVQGASGATDHRGRHPERLPIACEGEHFRFGRPRQPDGWPPRRPAQGHRFGPGRSDSWFEAARTLAFGVATDGGQDEAPDPLVRIAFEELARVAELHVAAATGITSSAGGVSFEAVGTRAVELPGARGLPAGPQGDGGGATAGRRVGAWRPWT